MPHKEKIAVCFQSHTKDTQGVSLNAYDTSLRYYISQAE
jgi:hypothetical protein